MIILNSYSFTPNFQSRKKEIRDADKIMRNANNNYPVTSPSKVIYYSTYKKDKNKALSKIYTAKMNLELMRNNINLTDGLEKVKNTIDSVNYKKIACCGEMARIMQGAFIANGYKDTQITSLKRIVQNNSSLYSKPLSYQKPIDHAFLLVNAGKNANIEDLKTINKQAFVVDPWLGFVDYVPNALVKYENFFNIETNDEESDEETTVNKLVFDACENKLDITSSDCKKMAILYPEFVINNKTEKQKLFGLF